MARPGDARGGPETAASVNLDDELRFYRVDRNVNASSRTDKQNDDATMVAPVAG